MLNYLKQEANKTVTENGAATHITTESDCLDLFATIGALRRESDSEIVTRFVRAYSENRDIAMKLLFFARDIRGGLGERRVFKVILNWLANNEPELPAKLIIISDMEFDRCVSNADSTNFKNAKEKFEAHGYKLPDIVFWNVASRNRQQPVTKNEQGVALVSGCTPRLFEMVASGTMNPYAFMLEVVESERYAKIVA